MAWSQIVQKISLSEGQCGEIFVLLSVLWRPACLAIAGAVKSVVLGCAVGGSHALLRLAGRAAALLVITQRSAVAVRLSGRIAGVAGGGNTNCNY